MVLAKNQSMRHRRLKPLHVVAVAGCWEKRRHVAPTLVVTASFLLTVRVSRPHAEPAPRLRQVGANVRPPRPVTLSHFQALDDS